MLRGPTSKWTSTRLSGTSGTSSAVIDYVRLHVPPGVGILLGHDLDELGTERTRDGEDR